MSFWIKLGPVADDPGYRLPSGRGCGTAGLGLTFLQEVQSALATISQFFEAAPLLYGGVRRKVLPKFPYTLFYSLREGRVRILALAHEKRRPFYWRARG